jgi:hypothetical protein
MKRYRRILVALAILLSGTALIPYLSLSSERIAWQQYAGPYGPPPGDVTIDDSGFDPPTLCVPPGTTLRWVNNGSVPHTVTSANGLFDSGPLQPAESFEHTFNESGVYPYFCSIHPSETAEVVVSPRCGAVGGVSAPLQKRGMLLIVTVAAGITLAAAGATAMLLRRSADDRRASS